MLQISNELRNAIVYQATNPASNNLITFSLVKIGFDTQLLMTDAPRNITVSVDSVNRTYTPSNNLLSVSPPKSEGEIDRDIFQITLSDPSFSLAGTLSQEATGIPVDVRLGFITDTEELIAETLPVYSGQISSWGSKVENNEPVVTITCTGPLTKLKQVTNRLTTKDNQQNIHDTDSCFDYSFDTGNEASLRWGPAPPKGSGE